jgi:putative transposase
MSTPGEFRRAASEAGQRNPERFATTKDPKILAIPATAWINQPAADDVELAA